MSSIALGLMGVYLAITLTIGVIAYRKTGLSPQEYFLAGSSLGRVVFPLTMFATLMSAFLFVGSAGFGYSHGMAWMAMIGVEAVAGIPLAVIGVKAWRRAKAAGYVTPTEFLRDAFDSSSVALLVIVVQFAWAIPYVAIQAMGGGIIFETISGGSVPFWAGALIVSSVTGLYLAMGGLRSVAWSDVLQGVTLVVMLVAALVFVVPAVDPFALTERLAAETGLLTTAGAVGFFTPKIWFSFILMNSMAIIAYPQMFQRFFAAKDERSFRALLVWWPVMAIVAAVVPVLLGVWGTVYVPGLANPDAVVPAMLQEFAPPVVVGVVMGGALAAMMSTADSLVLTLSSLVSRDVYHAHLAREDSARRELWVGRATIAAILVLGYALALVANGSVPGFGGLQSTIVDLAVYFIQGNALLLPVFLAALYWPRANATGAIAAVIAGEGYFALSLVTSVETFGFLPFVPALALACLALVFGTIASTDPTAARTADPDA